MRGLKSRIAAVLLVAAAVTGCGASTTPPASISAQPAALEQRLSTQADSHNNNAEVWAVAIVGGRTEGSSTELVDLANLRNFTKAMDYSGVPASNRFILTGNRAGEYPGSYPVSLESISAVAQYLTQSVGRKGTAFFYFTGHGNSYNGVSYMNLQKGTLDANTLAAKLKNLQGNTVVVIDQCKGAGYLKSLWAANHSAQGFSVADSNELAWATSAYGSDFTKYFFSALASQVGDFDRSGKTSILEAATYAFRLDSRVAQGDYNPIVLGKTLDAVYLKP